MRALIPGLESPHRLGPALPALYQEDDFAQRLLAALDEVLAPIFCTLDNLECYLDPWLAPADFVEWLAGWVGLALDENWPIERQRALVSGAAELYRWRGTVKGLAAYVALYTGSEPTIEESGGISWSSQPGSPVPGTRRPAVRVRVPVSDPSPEKQARVEAIVAAARPADVAYEVEVVAG